MKKQLYKLLYLVVALSMITTQSCNDYLDLDAKNKIPGSVVLNDAKGIEAFLANLYFQAPIEDFAYFPFHGFNERDNTGMLTLAQYGTEAIHSEWPHWNEYKNDWWEKGYKLNRDINILLEAIPEIKDIPTQEKAYIEGEALFLRAYTYYALAKRYGGVPLILETQEYDPDFDKLKRPRNTEKETWDLVLSTCDKAVALLPEVRTSDSQTKRRATTWAAYALKSRAALHAASVAKYWNQAPLSGEAVDKKMIGGMTTIDANEYYEACISASEELMKGQFGLYKANPVNPAEAAKNYQRLFTDPNEAAEEVIFMKGYAHVGGDLAHDYDGWNAPNQLAEGFPHRGRTNPILELIDLYEDYTKPGLISPVITRTDGTLGDYEGYNSTIDYRKFNTPEDIFKNKDARFFASVIYPNAEWKNTTIVIQGGIVKPDGTTIETKDSLIHNNKIYYTFGEKHNNQYSGFDGSADVTRSGFLMRKFLNEGQKITTWRQSNTDFMDMRYAEVLLNFAEAVVESGNTAKMTKATQAINDIRKRAGHTTNLPAVTLQQVLRERAVELAFENKGYWDLIRRRTFHTEFKDRLKGALVPMIDLRGANPQYIFVRRYVRGTNPQTFPEKDYYRHIPGVSSNGAIQNPQH